MKIVIVAYHFWPDEAIGAVRPENWARWLADRHEVVVLTREMSGAEKTDFPFRIVRPRSLAIRCVDALNRIRKRRRQAFRQAAVPRNEEVKATSSVQRPSGAFTYRLPCLYDVWMPACLIKLRELQPDVVIATHSPYVNLIAAWLFTRLNPRAKLWLDFRDLWVGSHQARGLPLLRSLEAWIEKKMLKDAAAVSVVSNGLADYFAAVGIGSKVHLVYNAPAPTRSHDSLITTSQTKSATDLVIAYTGTVYSRDSALGALFMLIQECQRNGDCAFRKVTLQVASRSPGNLFEVVARTGSEKCLDYVGAVSRKRSMEIQNQADVLLLLGSGAPEARGVLTGKVFEYLDTGKPILLLGPGPDSELHQLLSSLGRLLTLDDMSEIILGNRGMPTYEPIDFSEKSRAQLLSIVEGLR